MALFLILLSLQLHLSSCAGADPPGHMRPLGSHRPPEAVARVSEMLSPEEFYWKYHQPHKPVVMEGIITGTEVFKNWGQDEYLR